MRTYTAELSTASIDRLIQQIEGYRDVVLQPALMSGMETIAANATKEAQTSFGSAVSVTYAPQEPSMAYTITGTGKAVGFLEFGAGIWTEENHELAANAPFPVYEWSYSELSGSGEGYAKGYWHFGGRVFYGIQPRRGLYNASSFVKANAAKIIRSALR